MYAVFENNKPCNAEGFPEHDLGGKGWDTNEFATLEEARDYVNLWSGDNPVPELEVDQEFDMSGYGDMIVIRCLDPYAKYPKLMRKELKDIDQKKVQLLAAERIAIILEEVTEAINAVEGSDLVAYPEFYYSWNGFRGKLQINGIENMKEQIPPIITLLAKHGYKVENYKDDAQNALRTYFLQLRDNEDVQDIHIASYLAQKAPKCRYVQVGTRVKTEAVYELRCDDPINKSEPDDGSGEPMDSDNESGEQPEPESVPQDGTECGDSTDSANLSEGLQPDSGLPTVDDEGPVERGEE